MSKQREELNEETKPPPIWGWVQDRLYDTVFHIGDTTQQFLWDMMQGPENPRQEGYVRRQSSRKERQGQPPLSKQQQQVFAEITQRQAGEGLLDFWKRRGSLLSAPNKPEIITSYLTWKGVEAERAPHSKNPSEEPDVKKLEAVFKEVTQQKASSDRPQNSSGQSQK